VSAILEVEGLGVRLGSREVLRDVSFAIGPGELTGLIGTNGAGKTTLLRAILGLEPAATGTVRIAGAGDAGGSAVGYVPQKFLLDPDVPLRARDLVGLGIDGHRFGLAWPSRARRERIERVLADVGASAFADARVGELSGGEQQRVLIAHALIGGPRLLALDEPLANLDLRSTQETVALLRRIAREQGIAILISAHDMNPLMGAMTRVVYLAGGRAASGPTREVVRTSVLSELYGHHVDVLSVHGRILVVAGVAGELDDTADHGHEQPQVEFVS